MMSIPLTRGHEAIVDEPDFERVKKHKWNVMPHRKTFYAQGWIVKNGKKQKVLMHRFIMRARPNQQVDHKDGNALNNSRGNLRFCSHGQNLFNQSKRKNTKSRFKGVCWHKQARKWMAICQLHGKAVRIFGFSNEVDAAVAYNFLATMMCPQFARLNAV